MPPLYCSLISFCLVSLSGCQCYNHGEGLRFFWEPKFQEYSHLVEHRHRDGTISRGQHRYCATPSMSGNTLETAVIMGCYNMICGGDDEEHLLKMRFPNSTWEPSKKGPETVKSHHRYYHVYHVTDPDCKTHLFWINASSYHDLF